MSMNSTILAASLKNTLIEKLGVDLNDPKVQEANVEQNITDTAQALAEVIIEHIQTYATVSFSSGTITGICPTSGGPLANGTGINGKVL